MTDNTFDTNRLLEDAYQSLLLGYAAGMLDQAQTLIVTTHISMSPFARHLVRSYETLGGCLIEDFCEPVAMSANALDKVMARLEAPQCTEEECEAIKNNCPFFAEFAQLLPEPMRAQMEELCAGQHWSHLMPGIDIFDLPLDCKQSHARFMKVSPAGATPHHGHRGLEITLILDGAYGDETGNYKRGDLIVSDENTEHTPKACPDQGCTCMVVTSAPIRLTGLARLLNPFLPK